MFSSTGMLPPSEAGGGNTGGVEGARLVLEVAALALSDGNSSRLLNTSSRMEVSGVLVLN